MLARIARSVDWLLVLALFIILGFSFLAIASVVLSADPPLWSLLVKQGTALALGVGAIIFLTVLNYRFFRAASNWFYLVGILVLILVLLFGRTIRGTTGWFVIGGWSMQPSEFVKVIATIFLARYFTDYARSLHAWRHLFLSGVGVAMFMVLILAQPDFGTASVYFLLWLLSVIVIGIPLRRTVAILLAMACIGAVSWFFFFQDYQRARILTFLTAARRDTRGGGYQVEQSLIAVGSGGIVGKGFGAGSQSQLRFLPAAETDFVFSVIAEEFGLIGVSVFLSAWIIFFWRLIAAARGAADNFGAVLVLCVALVFAVQLFMNVGMTVGFFPITGVTLPLVSYGGSALMTHLILVGLAFSVIRHR
ncbi:rod shape-determining protein RodA [Candidatus Uhrbacteria bacterium]|nr:rod shape-determining protein RodA [Candidatus Uhrbacteria bacterium]